MTIHHVPIERRFAKPSEKHLVDPDFLSLWGEHASGSLSWDDFKDNYCVVVLADGKCGKLMSLKDEMKYSGLTGRYRFHTA
ncbi:hypothetical protein JCM19239_5762 [Vibrio variabilis]|uniref:Uncharacterized protein n=1 Tax=Vibrio variabilis TaxID=990271 RepID=A0ABQ0JIJ0_9VIBR|nr:hypothetical protein JCM19239_5762 [Vibrio variabilis]